MIDVFDFISENGNEKFITINDVEIMDEIED